MRALNHLDGNPYNNDSANLRVVTMTKTMPCPFCGIPPQSLARRVNAIFLVGCDEDECHVNPQCAGQTPEEAWARWNTRFQPVVSQLEAAGSGRGML